MTFAASKLIGFFLQPSVLILLGLMLGLYFIWTNWHRAGKTFVFTATVLYFLGSFGPLSNWLMLPLESRFSRPVTDVADLDVAGIIVLGGAVSTHVIGGRGVHALNENAERMTEALVLAKQLPDLPIVFSGGSNQIFNPDRSEANASDAILRDLLGDRENVMLETRSRNTRENARFTAKMLPKVSNEPWLLVTSAYHMARSVGCFRRAGVDVVAWPVDYRLRDKGDLLRPFAVPSNGLRRLDLVVKEWVGLVAYYLLGHTGDLFPRP